MRLKTGLLGKVSGPMKIGAWDGSARVRSLVAIVLAAGVAAAVAQRKSASLGESASQRDAVQIAAIKDPANLAKERVSAPVLADTLEINHGAPALAQLLKKLRTRASLMMIVAHPDDEDGGMLTYESRGQGARVAMLTLNRGEGGQNLMSGDFNDALGLIRTQELLAADRYMGVDQMFGSVIDFGFSKTREETLEQWGHDRVLYDAVRAVRLYRPLVLTSVFVGGVTDGHGHHQVAGQICQEVFTAAGDPKVFPEMGLPPWSPMKVYARAPFARIDAQGMFDYATGKYSPAKFYNYVTKTWSDSAPEPAVMVHEGEVSNAPGMDGASYVQFARKGLGLQKSQVGGGARLAPAGAFDSGYARYGSHLKSEPKTEESFFDGVDVTLAGIAELAPSATVEMRGRMVGDLKKVDASVGEAQRVFNLTQPELTAGLLREALKTLDGLIAVVEKAPMDSVEKFNVLHELRIKRVQANDALVLAHGLTMEATLADSPSGLPVLTTQREIAVEMKVAYAGSQALTVERAEVDADGKMIAGGVSGTLHGVATERAKVELPHGLPATRPYFSRTGLEQPYYDIADPSLRNAPATPAPLTGYVTVDDGGVKLTVAATVSYAGSGVSARREPVVVVPPISVELMPSAGIVVKDTAMLKLNARVRSSAAGAAAGSVKLALGGDGAVDAGKSFTLAKGGDEAQIAFDVPAVKVPEKKFKLEAVATESGVEYREGFRAVGYAGLVTTNYFTPATYRASKVEVKTAPGLKVGYLPGTGDDVAEYLRDLGVTPVMLSGSDLTAAKLSGFDAVVLGVRAYAAQAELVGAGSKALMEYAKNGGVVIVQYNTARYGDGDAPYAIEVPGSSDMNVVVETDPVTLLMPDAQVLAWPNRITAEDFDGWVEERGHGFARSWGPEYQALLETHDPGQEPMKGGLLMARVGKGYYIYTALALYRQLPEGVPGAYRIMANLISLGKNPAK